jgi:hypothetical protein
MYPKYRPLGPGNIMGSIGAVLFCSAFSMRPIWGTRAALRACWSSLRLILKSSLARVRDRKEDVPVTLITFTIHPDLARVWHFFAIRSLRGFADKLRIVIVDCSGRLRSADFPQALVVPFCNFSHARKVDFFYTHFITSRFVWLCDDDMMIVGKDAFERAYDELESNNGLAVISFAPRGWSIPVGGQVSKAMGSYSIIFSRNIFLKEKLSFSPVQTDRPEIGRIKGYYDTADFANELLLRKGYTVITNGYESDHVGFVGTSTSMLRCLGQSGWHEHILRLVRDNPQAGSYHLVGLFCNWKTVSLYEHAFGQKASWYPPVKEEDLREYASELPVQYRENTYALFARYECNYRTLQQIITSEAVVGV